MTKNVDKKIEKETALKIVEGLLRIIETSS